ncbi:MAG: CRISPR-associated endonuclease Cas3'', partial [Halothiobacillaceae bacterium]
MSQSPIAHVSRNDKGDWRPPHDLAEHLAGVAKLAACFARAIGEDWARLAGLWHDLGKYRPGFQRYIRNQSGFERENAHIEGEGQRVEHSAAGAVHAIDTLGDIHGRLLAYLIAGHHTGLPDWNGAPSSLFQRLDKARREGHLDEALSEKPPKAIIDASGLKPLSRPKGEAE